MPSGTRRATVHARARARPHQDGRRGNCANVVKIVPDSAIMCVRLVVIAIVAMAVDIIVIVTVSMIVGIVLIGTLDILIIE